MEEKPGTWRLFWRYSSSGSGSGSGQGRLDTSQPPFWLAGERRSADRAHKRVSGRSEDATCNMLHSRFVKPTNAKLPPLIDYVRGERLVRVEAETEGSDQG